MVAREILYCYVSYASNLLVTLHDYYSRFVKKAVVVCTSCALVRRLCLALLGQAIPTCYLSWLQCFNLSQVLTNIMIWLPQKSCQYSFYNQDFLGPVIWKSIFLKNSTTNGSVKMARFHWWLNFLKILIFKGEIGIFLRHWYNIIYDSWVIFDIHPNPEKFDF